MDRWGHRWFGFWSEDGAGYEKCPRIIAWPRNGLADELAEYLASAVVVCVGQVGPRQCHLCETQLPTSRTWLSDGKWLWPDDLLHYLREHRIAVPAEFRAHVSSATPRDLRGVIIDADNLDWPGEGDQKR